MKKTITVTLEIEQSALDVVRKQFLESNDGVVDLQSLNGCTLELVCADEEMTEVVLGIKGKHPLSDYLTLVLSGNF